jgi:brefeldin A-resistance guanine nucleotide exchange factor 1
MMTSPDFWVILRAVAGDANAAAQIFDILERSTAGTPPAIMADNYEAAISLLNHFASAADPLASRDSKSLEPTRRDA